MHLRQLQLCLGANSLRESGVSDEVAKGLPAVSDVSTTADTGLFVWFHDYGDLHSYLCGSYFSNTFRFVWSRMILLLINPPRSSRFARNGAVVGILDGDRSFASVEDCSFQSSQDPLRFDRT